MIPSFNIIFGFPGEGWKERREPVNFMMDMCRKFPGAEFGPTLHPISRDHPYSSARRSWESKCQSLSKVGLTIFLATRSCRGSKAAIINACKPCETTCASPFDREPIATTGHGKFAKAVQHLTAYPARVRLNYDFYSFPVELWINRQLKNIVKLPKPSIDAKRLQPETAPSC